MSWWFWILLWVALVVLALLFFALLGFRLFKTLTAMLRELDRAGGKLAMPGQSETPAGVEPELEESLPPGSGIFLVPRESRVQYKASKLQRQELRRQRRMERKTLRGQPQALRDLR